MTMMPGNTLHASDWQPLWRYDTDPADEVERLAKRALRRSAEAGIPPGTPAGERCLTALRAVLAAGNQAAQPAQVHDLAAGWCEVFDAVIDAVVPNRPGCRQVTAQLRRLLERIWHQAVVVTGDESLDPADSTDERLYLDIDRVFRGTHALPVHEGNPVRRAFLGVVTSAAELSGLNPYARLIDGIVRTVENTDPAWTGR
ncbi:hypothetical protein ABZ348_13070 [Streptomyces sp. NPDC005963]|uniref:hypothetical protein n=1 Tax=Streptomyces sp. NPDC005963 TaxID=3156721 RepID=UPI0033F6DB23